MNRDSATDTELMERVREGDEKAFNTLYHRHYHHMMGYLIHQETGYEDAKDILQHVWLQVWDKASQFSGQQSFISWAYAILRHKVTDMHRHDECVRRHTHYIMLEHRNSGTTISHRRRLDVDDALRHLDPDQTKLVIRVMHGYTHGEIGQIDNVNEKTIAWRYFNALEKVRHALGLASRPAH